MKTRRISGSIRQLPSGRWQARYRDPSTNRLVAAPGTFGTKADADGWLATVRADVLRGSWVDPNAGRVKLAEYSSTWLERRPELAERTAELYAHLLARHVLPELGSSTLAGLEASAVRAWHARIARDHPTTAAKAYRLLSSIMRTAVADGMILRSPCRVEGAGVERAPERPVATVAEVAALADAMPEHLRIIVLLAAWCQLRRGELLGLRRRDVDPLHATITVEQTRTFSMTNNRAITKGPKTNAGRRTLTVPAHVALAVTDHLDRFVAPEPDAFVLTGEKGRPLALPVLTKAWDKARTRVGCPELRLHDLRHTGLTLAAATGATVAELMHRAGHASPAAALRYQHATADRDRVLADALAKLAEPAPVRPIEVGKPEASARRSST
jgi:integrase